MAEPVPQPTSRSMATASLPTNLPSRYEIRTLTRAEELWAIAILCHSQAFHNSMHWLEDPNHPTQGFHACMHALEYIVAHQINSGLSLGVFDLEYKYKRPESAATNGAFYWDPKEKNVTRQSLLEQMDFPLVSIALAHDFFDEKDVRRIRPVTLSFIRFGQGGDWVNNLDTRDPKTWKPTGLGQLLHRNATSTREDYQGKGLMGGMARFQMRWAKENGWRAISIGASSNAVAHVWTHPPAPFTATVVYKFNSWEFPGKNEKGENPYGDRRQTYWSIHVDL